MKGSHRVIVESKKVKYDFVLKIDVDIYMSIMNALIYIIIVIKHIPNIKRMINKNENTVARIK